MYLLLFLLTQKAWIKLRGVKDEYSNNRKIKTKTMEQL